MRDALSLLDQIMTCSEGSISAADVVSLLGATDRKLIFDLSKAVLASHVKDVLDTLDRAYRSGLDMKKLFADLVEHFRNLLVIKIEDKTHKLVDLPAYEIIQIKECITDVTAGYLNQLFNLLLNEEGIVRFSAQPKLVMEMVLLRMCQIEPALPVDVLIKKLEDLRVEFSGGVEKREDKDTHPVNHEDRGNLPERNCSFPETNAPDGENETEAAENIERLWKRVVEIASDKHPMLAAALTKCSLNALSEKGLEIIVNGSDFNMNLIQRSKNQAALERIIQDLLGKRIQLIFKAKKEKDPNNHRKRDHENRLRKEALSHPLVAETLDVFNGEIVDVKIL
jgi:DNA polymerase-3 subunit gamma/tau